MITRTISTRFDLKWEVKTATDYKFTHDGKCINTRTGREIKQAVSGGYTFGYHINGKFISAKRLRPLLRKIAPIDCPF